jgi:predicted deacylase
MKKIKKLDIANQSFLEGESAQLKIRVGRITAGNLIYVQGHVYRSKKAGPTTLLLAGVHGDEINGIETIRRIMDQNVLEEVISGTVIVVPIVNVFGFINSDRYVPDGKDVNRSFPGSLNGSLASRIARTLTKYLFPIVDYIIDFHTGGDFRYNYPQIRYTKGSTESKKLAEIFHAPYTIATRNISKSLRKTAHNMGITSIVFEGGESIRINPEVITSGIEGVLRCLHHLGHITDRYVHSPDYDNIIIEKTSWRRAKTSGILIKNKVSGDYVKKGTILGTINDPYGRESNPIIASMSGHIIGHNNASLVNYGDAVFHIGAEKK